MLDAFLIALNVAAFLGYGAIPLDVFFPDRSVLIDWLPPGKLIVASCRIARFNTFSAAKTTTQ